MATTLIQFGLYAFLIAALVTGISQFIPESLSSNITAAFSYFLGMLNFLSPLMHMSTVFAAMKTFIAFVISLMFFRIMVWFYNHLMAK